MRLYYCMVAQSCIRIVVELLPENAAQDLIFRFDIQTATTCGGLEWEIVGIHFYWLFTMAS